MLIIQLIQNFSEMMCLYSTFKKASEEKYELVSASFMMKAVKLYNKTQSSQPLCILRAESKT